MIRVHEEPNGTVRASDGERVLVFLPDGSVLEYPQRRGGHPTQIIAPQPRPEAFA